MRIGKRLVAAVMLASAVAGVALTAAPAQAAVKPNTNNTKIDFGRMKSVPWSTVTLPDGTACPGGHIEEMTGPKDGEWGAAVHDGLFYQVNEGAIADVTGDGYPDQLVRYSCTVLNTNIGFHFFYLYSFYKTPYGPELRPIHRRFITSSYADETGAGKWTTAFVSVTDGAVDVGHTLDTQPGVLVRRTFTPTETPIGMVADRPLPDYPQADTAPPTE
ncbi:hypothetical protein [Cryptosporangium sp. NPDC051539]|uniref:hypothetical protein n=1 Tax=Cryptosporangium sp. NPDC051539 TaxID=3363962 RepID=UPI00378E84CE